MRQFVLQKLDAFIWKDAHANMHIITYLQTRTQPFVRSVRRLLLTANIPSSPNLFTRMMEALRSSETSTLTRAILRRIPEDGILHSHSRENLKSYKENNTWIFTSDTEHFTLYTCTFWDIKPWNPSSQEALARNTPFRSSGSQLKPTRELLETCGK
jgi:hypothetical protein